MSLSIIIPIYKIEPYLRECLDSVAASPLDCWEAILVDDGSPDGCPQICDEYAGRDRRFRVIHQENGGVAAARNAGLDAAQGEWVWFVDTDDVVDMRYVEDMMRWLRNNDNDTEQSSYDTLKLLNADATKTVDVHVDVHVNKKVDLVMFDLETFKDGESIECKSSQLQVVDEHLSKNDFLMKHACYHHPRLWYRRSQLRFTCGIKTGEDGEFMYKYLMRCKHPVRVLSTSYYYRIRQGSATNSENSRAQVVKDTIQVLYNLLSYMKEHDITLEPWLTIRLQGTMKILLYSIYKSKQHHKKEMQRTIRHICNQYKYAGYHVFDSLLLRIARCSIPVYCLLLQLNLRIKGLK